MLALRNANPALHHGSVERCEMHEDIFVIERLADGQHIRCLFNLGSLPVSVPQDLARGSVLAAVNSATPNELPPFGAMVIEL